MAQLRRYELTDAEWSIIDPLLPRKFARVDDRRVLIHAKLAEQGAYANIRPLDRRIDPPAFSPRVYKLRNCVERFYNLRRRHSTLGYLSPIDFEAKMRLA